MRDVTRNLLLGLAAVGVLLLALGALPSHLRSGDPYYLTATAVDGEHASVNGSALSERRFPYTTSALAEARRGDDGVGRADAYYRGPFGVKGAFTHSPFDELESFRARHPSAVANDTAYVTVNGTLYEVRIVQEERA